MKLTENDFVGPFPAHVKPCKDGLYWSGVGNTNDPMAVYAYGGGFQPSGITPDTLFNRGKWVFYSFGESGEELMMQNRQWIGLTAEAAKRVAWEMK
jgi:hypothetical protein